MKVIKDAKTSLLLKSFLLNNQDYLSISILYYFDFNNPDAPLEEQAMYRETKDELGKTLLDYAMAKPKAEVLACGSCFNYTPESGASHVKLSVAEIQKELYVFGERKWKNGTITKPLPFKSIPIDYPHAKAEGEYLPNIEDPKHLISSKGEVRDPASFMPLDMFSQQNMKKLGTHNEKYKRELWPGFAEDMDYSFFNVAPLDQQRENFFEGGESIKILNMHPKKQLLTSYIPKTSFRCFATKTQRETEDEFKEIILKRDTLWLFPTIQRGVVIFRGILKVEDEIYSDIKYLNIKPLFEGDKEKSLDEYYAEQKKELDKSIEIDETPFEDAEKKITEAKKEIFDIPRQVKEGILKTQGKRPSLKRDSAEKIEQSNARIDKAIARIDKAKIKLKNLKDEFGHIVKIDTTILDNTKAELLASKQKLSSTLRDIDTMLQNTKDMKKEALLDIENLKNSSKIPDNIKENIDFDFLKDKEKLWSDYAFDFVCKSVKSLEKLPEELHKLRHLGFAKRTIQRSWVGFNSESKVFKAESWNLKSDKDIELPKGLVTVRFEDAIVKSIKINGKVVSGSDENYELFLSQESSTFPLFYFKDDDIQAHLCDQEAFDICNTLSCNDISNVGDNAKKAIEGASVIFYLQEDGVVEKLPHAKMFDCGEYKNLFELHQNSIEIREQIIQNLPKNIADTLPLKRDFSTKAIRERSLKYTQKLKDDLKQNSEKIKQEMEKHRDKILTKVNEVLGKHELKGVTLKQDKTSSGFIAPSEISQSFDKAISVLQKQNKKPNIDIDHKILELQKSKEEMILLAKKGEAIYLKGMQRLAKVQEKAKDPIPDWAKEKMKKAGIDPNNPHANKLSREDVIRLHSEGKSFAMKNLSKLDLSNLDLSKIDLSMANCGESNFKNTNLSGAKFEQTNFNKTDFTHTKLIGVKAQMCNFKESVFDGSILDDFKGDMALFEKVVLKGIKIKNCCFDGFVFKDCTLKECLFEDCSFEGVSFLNSTINTTGFYGSSFEKPLFSESELNGCEFVNIDSKAILFNKSKIINCDFSQSKLSNMRVLKESVFEKNSFISSDMQKTTIFEATIKDCDFQKTKLDKSLIKKSELIGCNFKGAIAKGSRFEYASAKECSFVGINLLKGSLRRMDLKICDFSDSNLYGVEFYKTKFYEVKLDGANLKRSSLENRVEIIYD